jgi:hypothetical protein
VGITLDKRIYSSWGLGIPLLAKKREGKSEMLGYLKDSHKYGYPRL